MRNPSKLRDPRTSLAGEPRAKVALQRLKMLWVNTGTLCNIACAHCYIESSPRNDRLAYLSLAELRGYLDEIARERLGTEEIGFTGGEPFMNPDFPSMLDECLGRGLRVRVLTNAMRPMQRLKAPLLGLHRRHGDKLALRVSLDHYTRELHEEERGADSWEPTLDGLRWLTQHGFALSIAGRLMWGETEVSTRQGFRHLFERLGIPVNAEDPAALVLFPEMDANADVPEISAATLAACGPDRLMCATSRMVVKHKHAAHPTVTACTLLPYEPEFSLGRTLGEASRSVTLNHPHCAKFCVFGGSSCG